MLNYILEFRRRALHISAIFFGFFLLFYWLADSLFHFLLSPLTGILTKGESLIATELTSPVLIPLKLAANTALLCTTPIILLQFWGFVAPGLYQLERRHLRGMLLGSFTLFCLGLLFCFYLILPMMLQFFTQAVPPGVKFMPDIAYALDFITRMLLIFGLGFQVPLICLVLIWLEWIDKILLKKMRPYIYVAAFTVGMLLTPPDVLSQVMLAIPLCLLYELGVILVNISPGAKQE